MVIHELTSVYAEPPSKTTGPLITWFEYWAIYNGEFRHSQFIPWRVHLRAKEWLLDKLAFGNDGVRMIER